MGTKRTVRREFFPPCSATSKSTGKPCRNRAIPGGTVCKYHGGGAPQVKEAARHRLLEFVGPALDLLQAVMDDYDEGKTSPTDALRAVQIILDRTGYHAKSGVEVSGEDGGPIESKTQIDVSKLPTDVLRAVLEAQKDDGG